jgi:hypothetical protein
MEASSVPSAQPRRFRWWILGAVLGAVLGLMICAIVSIGALSLLGKKVEPHVVTATDGQSRLTVPGTWSVQTDLHDDAEIQAANLSQEQYMIVLTESKADFVDTEFADYNEIVAESVAANASADETPDGAALTINGRPAMRYEVHGTVDNMKVVYWLTTVDGEQNYYQVLAWTLESKAEQNAPVFDEVVQSFQEVAQ